MPPLHEALVEVHQEYEKVSRAAKDMADLNKKATTTSNELNAQCIQVQEENQQLKEQCNKHKINYRKQEYKCFSKSQ